MRNLFAYDDRHCVKINERQLKAFGNVIKSVMCTKPTTIVTTNNNNQSERDNNKANYNNEMFA